jgi:carbon-monoxide dehydrogenase medium subunit
VHARLRYAWREKEVPVYPPAFEYLAPRTLDEALSALDAHSDEAKVLAGGQSLIPLMKLRFAAPEVIVDVNRIPGLDEIDESGGGLRIGALVRHKTCERSPILRGRFGALGTAAGLIADPVVRNRGTVCGSLAHADPQGDWASALLAVGADVEVRSASGERTIPLEDFISGPFTTVLEPNELVTGVTVRDPGAKAAGTYLKLERKVGDYATVGVAVHVSFDDGVVRRAGIALTAVAPANVRATAAEESLAGKPLNDETIDEAARLAAEAANPHSDVRGSAEFKRNVVRTFTVRGLHAVKEGGST